jgi:hypothetical protein
MTIVVTHHCYCTFCDILCTLFLLGVFWYVVLCRSVTRVECSSCQQSWAGILKSNLCCREPQGTCGKKCSYFLDLLECVSRFAVHSLAVYEYMVTLRSLYSHF